MAPPVGHPPWDYAPRDVIVLGPEGADGDGAAAGIPDLFVSGLEPEDTEEGPL